VPLRYYRPHRRPGTPPVYEPRQVRPGLAPKTHEGYVYIVGLITPALGKVPLDKLTPQHVQKLLNDLLAGGGTGGRRLSPRTVQYARATLRRALGLRLSRFHGSPALSVQWRGSWHQTAHCNQAVLAGGCR